MTTIKRECATCKGYLGEIVTGNLRDDGKVSHGTCNNCLAEKYKEINDIKRQLGQAEVDVPFYPENEVKQRPGGPEGRGL